MSEPAKIRIGAWTVTPALGLIERGTSSIRIEPRAMDVLVMLAQRGEAPVPVDELIATVWKGVVVGDGSVYLAINQLRQALDDPAGGIRHIETIPKRGYRLTVPVEFPGSPTAPAQLSAPPVAPAPRPAMRRRLPRWILPAVAGALVLAVAAWVLRKPADPVPGPESAVAVLPFENLSSDPEQQYFADGITVEILDTLTRVRGLQVTARASSFGAAAHDGDLRTLGQVLGVHYVLEGSVRKAGDQVRISAQLRNARTGVNLWGRTYERRLDDLFAIQDEIAASVASALQIGLGVGDLARVPGMTRDVAAYDEYLRGMSLNLDWRPESFARAITHLRRAVDIDPSFSVAWVGLSTAYANGATSVPARAGEWQAGAAEALERARSLTPDSPHVLLEAGIGQARRKSWLEAAATYARLQAAYARHGMAEQAWGPRGIFLLAVGRLREAIPALERARAKDPLAPAFAWFLGLALSGTGELDAAQAEVDRGLQLEGLDPLLREAGLAIALARKDEEGIRLRLQETQQEDPGSRVHREMARFVDAPAGAAAHIRSLAPAANYTEKGLLAQWAAYHHEPELAVELLAAAAPGMAHPGPLWHPVFQDARRLPSFRNLMRDLGLVEYWNTYGWPDYCQPADAGGDFTCR